MIAETADIRFKCNKCGQHLVVESAGAGLTTDCPICNTTVTVPSVDSTDHTSKASTESNGRHGLSRTPTPVAVRSPYADPVPDELREELTDANLLNGKLLGDLGKSREEMLRLQHQLKAMSEECERLNASSTHTQAELKTFQSERAQLKNELSSVKQRLAVAEAELANRTHELEEALAAHQSARGESTQLGATLAAAQLELSTQLSRSAHHEQEAQAKGEALGTMQAQLVAREGELQAAQQRLGQLEPELHQEKENATRLGNEVQEARQQLEAAHGDLHRTGTEKAQVETDLQAHRDQLVAAEETNRSLTDCAAGLRRETESLRRDLAELHTGRDLIEARERLGAAVAERERFAERVKSLESDLQALSDHRTTLSAELKETRQQRDQANATVEAFSESRIACDNAVLRGIITRQNTDLVQRTAELTQLKRARSALKLSYVIFGIGFLAVAILAIKILPHALK